MDNPGDLHSKEPTCEMPLILLLCCKDSNIFRNNKQIQEKTKKKHPKTAPVPSASPLG